ncbi:MAG: putative DNA-binding domain-containing protein [Pseudomonadota bacterium]
MSTEARRQAAVLRALWDQPAGAGKAGEACPGWREEGPVLQRGLSAYRGNAAATAERALAAAYSTIRALLGDEAMAVLGSQLWQAHPPSQGDLSRWGQHLPDCLSQVAVLKDWPYLSDCARLDWARHTAEQAQDAVFEPQSLHLLEHADPNELVLQLRPGTRVIPSSWPIVTIWTAHQAGGASGAEVAEHALESMRQALSAGQAETAVVWRTHWRAEVYSLPHAMLTWMNALSTPNPDHPASLATLLEAAPVDFNLTDWLTLALRHGWLWRARVEGQVSDPSD